jgi:hypothetical protein
MVLAIRNGSDAFSAPRAGPLSPDPFADRLVPVVNYADMVFLSEIGALDWGLAGMMCFQKLIHERGTKEEQDRLREIGVGYP